MGMQYNSTILDRRTGEVVSVDLGHFMSVTEFGKTIGLSARQVRRVLHVLGLARPEGVRGNYRLTPEAVQRGYGKRHDNPRKGKWAFDVLSPEGQKLVRENAAAALSELEAARVPKAQQMRDALEEYRAWRQREGLSEMTLQMEVHWLADSFDEATAEEIAAATDGAAGKVRQYLSGRRARLAHLMSWAGGWLPEPDETVRLSFIASEEV